MNAPPILPATGFKGVTTTAAGMFYAPYIPLYTDITIVKSGPRNPLELPAPDITRDLSRAREMATKLAALGFDADSAILNNVITTMDQAHLEYENDRMAWGLMLHSMSGHKYRMLFVALSCIIGTILAMRIF